MRKGASMKPGIQSRIGSQSLVDAHAARDALQIDHLMWTELLPLDLHIQCAVLPRSWKASGYELTRWHTAYIRSANK